MSYEGFVNARLEFGDRQKSAADVMMDLIYFCNRITKSENRDLFIREAKECIGRDPTLVAMESQKSLSSSIGQLMKFFMIAAQDEKALSQADYLVLKENFVVLGAKLTRLSGYLEKSNEELKEISTNNFWKDPATWTLEERGAHEQIEQNRGMALQAEYLADGIKRMQPIIRREFSNIYQQTERG